MLAAAGEEIIYLLDAEGQIPVNLQVRPAAGGVVLVLALAAADTVEITSAVPKAISFHCLRCEPDRAGRWSASMTVDV
jgi:SHS2 domain-containing protein